MRLLISILLLFLCFKGYNDFFTKTMHFEEHSGLYVSVMFIGLLMAVFALMNLMETGVILVLSLGILLFLFFLFKSRSFNLTYPKLMIAGIFILFCTTLWTMRLVHYDNFSHWARIVKFMIIENRLPIQGDAIIEFTSYPPGTAVFLYFVNYLTGYSEPMMLIAQFILIVSAMLASFSFVRDRKRLLPQALMFIYLAFSLYFSHSIGLDNLLVDYVMVVLAVAVLPVLISQRYNLRNMSFILGVSTFYIVLIKNSALYFTIPSILVYLIFVFKYHRKFLNIIFALSVSVLSLSSFVLWSRHVAARFTDTSKHDISWDYFIRIFNEKSWAQIKAIEERFIQTIFDLNSAATLAVLISLLAVAILLILLVLKRRHAFKRLFAIYLGLLIYIAFYFYSIYLMYLFSMPIEEALVLAGYERYAMSMGVYVLFLAGFLSMIAFDLLFFEPDVSKRDYRSYTSITHKKIYQLSSLVLCFGVLLFYSSENNILRINQKQYPDTIPGIFTRIAEERWENTHEKILIVSSDDQGQISSYYLHNIARHYLWTTDILIGDRYYEMSLEDFKAMIESTQTIIMIEHNISFDDMFYEAYGFHLSLGSYQTQELLQL